MFRRKKGNICGHWDCDKRIPDGSFLCDEHYKVWTDGLIDRCPKCGRFKDVMYQKCLDCYVGRPVARWEPPGVIPTPKQQYKVEFSDAWTDGYMSPERRFVYILEFGEGGFYVGHTTDLRKRLAEHRSEKSPSTAGRQPKLQYVQLVATQPAAELREAELKRLIESNPSQIRLMFADFHHHMREFELE